MNDKKLKRKVKELGLYSVYFNAFIQSKLMGLSDEFIKLCSELYNIGLLEEFLITVNDKHVGGLKSFRSTVDGNFNHVVEWMSKAPVLGVITYNNHNMNYSDYMNLKGFKR